MNFKDIVQLSIQQYYRRNVSCIAGTNIISIYNLQVEKIYNRSMAIQQWWSLTIG